MNERGEREELRMKKTGCARKIKREQGKYRNKRKEKTEKKKGKERHVVEGNKTGGRRVGEREKWSRVVEKKGDRRGKQRKRQYHRGRKKS